MVWVAQSRGAANRRRGSCRVRSNEPGGGGVSARSVAVTMVRKAWASTSRVVRRCHGSHQRTWYRSARRGSWLLGRSPRCAAGSPRPRPGWREGDRARAVTAVVSQFAGVVVAADQQAMLPALGRMVITRSRAGRCSGCSGTQAKEYQRGPLTPAPAERCCQACGGSTAASQSTRCRPAVQGLRRLVATCSTCPSPAARIVARRIGSAAYTASRPPRPPVFPSGPRG